MTAHSLYHSVGKASCKRPWERLHGDDTVRTCDQCNAKVYKLAQLSEEQAAQLIKGTEARADGELQLYRRYDGTFATKDIACTDGRVADYQDGIKTVFGVLRRDWYLPLLFVLLSYSAVYAHRELPAGQFAFMVSMIVGRPLILLLLAFRIIRAVDLRVNGPNAKPQPITFTNTMTGIGICIGYEIAKYLCLLMFVLPGVLVSARLSLALVVARIEDVGPLDAFRRSEKLTAHSFWDVVRYTWPPLVLSAAAWLAAVVINGFMMVDRTGPLQLIADFARSTVSELIAGFIGLSFIPLQVRLYYRLLERKVALNKAETTPPGN